jgi:ribosome maturation factor RimP
MGDLMSSGRIDEDLNKLVSDTVENLGYECVSVELHKSRDKSILRVFIDAPDSVMHGDCEKVSRTLSEYFDDSETEGIKFCPGK